MSVSDVRLALADALSSIGGVEVNAYAQATPSPPGLQILPPSCLFDFSFARGMDRWTYIIQGFVALGVAAQQLLDEMCDPAGENSVKASLEADRTLGGTVQQVTVVSQSPGRVANPSGLADMLLVEWTVDVIAPGR